MSFIVHIRPEAETDLEEAALWYEKQNPRLGDAFGRILVVIYTWRGDNIRIISARKAVRSEVKQYESGI